MTRDAARRDRQRRRTVPEVARRLSAAAVPDDSRARRLIVITLVDSIGTGTFLTSAAIFLNKIVGLTVREIGLGLSIAGGVALAASVPAGRLGDRRGVRGPLTTVYAALAAVFASYPLVGGFGSFVLVASLVAIGDAAGSPLRSALTHAVFTDPDVRLRVRALLRSYFNAGYAIGALLAGLALTVGGRTAFACVAIGNAVSYGVAAVIVTTLRVDPAVPVPSRGGARSGERPRGVPALRNMRFLGVTAANGALELYGSVLTVGVPLWVVGRTEAPAGVVGILVMLDAVLVVALQVPVTRFARDVPSATRALRRAGMLLACACIAFAAAEFSGAPAAAVAVLVLGVLLMTAGELLQSVGGWTLSFSLPPEGRQGEYQGVFVLGRSLQDIVGPFLVASVLTVGALGWGVLAAVFLAAGLVVTPVLGAGARRPVEVAGGVTPPTVTS